MSNSGYKLPQIRRVVVGGLSCYEKRLRQSKLGENEKGYKPIHESAKSSFVARNRKKLLGKSTWYKEDTNKETGGVGKDFEENVQKMRQEIRKQERKERKAKIREIRKKEKPPNPKNMTTTGVLFVESTPFGILAKNMQECEDRLGMRTGRRVKVVEMAGSQLSQVLPNTNPWGGQGCSRQDCHTCNQGGEEDKKEDCFRRNILYESICGTCEDRKGIHEKEKIKRKKGGKLEGRNIYVGKTSRSLYERSKEHIRDGRSKAEDSHIAKHWEETHKGEEMPHFRFKIVRNFQDCLSRQVAESVRIDLREDPLNSNSVYS